MVKTQEKDTAKSCGNQGLEGHSGKAVRIGPSTAYSYCSERLSAFGGLLGLTKFMDAVQFEELFTSHYIPPGRTPELGHFKMVYGIIILLYIGFNRIWHFLYLRFDSMLCGIFGVVKLPYVTTYWRYVDSLGINQGRSLLKVMGELRRRVWQACGIRHTLVHIDMDTTVETLYGKQQGGRKGHNTKHRGKKAYRPVLGFIEETREYIAGKLRAGETIGGEEAASLIRSFRKYLPECVKKVIIRGDGEFISWDAVKAAEAEGYHYIFGSKRHAPPFADARWYRVSRKDGVAYNESVYQPQGWEKACRFVVMRIPKEIPAEGEVQMELLEDGMYTYRTFATNRPGRPHGVIEEYDKRADCENLIGEAKREGLSAIPSGKFLSNYAYFQLVMLIYNIWRYCKIMAEQSLREDKAKEDEAAKVLRGIQDNTIWIARLKLLLIAAKITMHAKTNEVKYSQHDSRVPGLFRFMGYLDNLRSRLRPWLIGADPKAAFS